MDALKRANDVRTKRAQVKREMKRGRLSPLEAMGRPELDTMRSVDFLMAIPKVGRVKANRTLAQLRISPSRSVGGLSSRQRMALMERLAG